MLLSIKMNSHETRFTAHRSRTDKIQSLFRSQLPAILVPGGTAAVFAAEEFFFGRIRSEHPRAAYLVAIKRFRAWAKRPFDESTEPPDL